VGGHVATLNWSSQAWLNSLADRQSVKKQSATLQEANLANEVFDASAPRKPMAAACSELVVTEKTILLPGNGNGDGQGANYQLSLMVPKRRYWSYLRERWWAVLICLALTVSTVVVYETLRRETYSSFAQLYLSGEVQLTSVNNLVSEDSQNYFGTQIELLKSVRLQGEVLDKLGVKL